ncbi:MAG: hypothetical protein AB7N80_07750 [Bdellovibrionales bacterium]
MKTTFVALVLSVASFSAFGAKFESVKRLQSEDLRAIRAEYVKVAEFNQNENVWLINGAQRMVEEGAEARNNTVKQVVHRVLAPNVVHEVEVRPVFSTERAVRWATDLSTKQMEFRSARPREILAREVRDILKGNTQLNVNVIEFTGAFMAGEALLVEDPQTREWLLVGAEFAE